MIEDLREDCIKFIKRMRKKYDISDDQLDSAMMIARIDVRNEH